MKRIAVFLLSLIFAFAAFADESGECGNGVTYVYSEETQTLTISKMGEGDGKMKVFSYGRTAPWNSYSKNRLVISAIIINNGVTSIGNNAFFELTDLRSIIISDDVRSIGRDAFYGCEGLTEITIPNSVTSIGVKAFS